MTALGTERAVNELIVGALVEKKILVTIQKSGVRNCSMQQRSSIVSRVYRRNKSKRIPNRQLLLMSTLKRK